MLLQIRLLSKVFITLATRVFLVFLMNFTNVSIQSIFGAENKLTFHAMKLSGSFVNLFNVLPQSLGGLDEPNFPKFKVKLNK